MGFLVDADTPVIWRGPMIMKTCSIRPNVQWGDLEVLLIDMPPGRRRAALSRADPFVGRRVLVTTPQVAATNVRAAAA